MHQVPAMDDGRMRNRLRPWIWGGAAGLLALPAIAMRWFPASGVDWRAGDFVVMGALLAIAAGLWQVVARFATETPSVWSEALVRTALIWMAFLGVAVALRAGALVSIDVAHRYSSGAMRRALEAASLASALSSLGIMFWFGWMMAERVKFQEMAGLEVSMSWGYAAIPIGAVFAMVGAVAHFLDHRSEELDLAI